MNGNRPHKYIRHKYRSNEIMRFKMIQTPKSVLYSHIIKVFSLLLEVFSLSLSLSFSTNSDFQMLRTLIKILYSNINFNILRPVHIPSLFARTFILCTLY